MSLSTSEIVRHPSGDRDEVDEHDRKANEYALEHCPRELSSYILSTGVRIWIISEAGRNSTTILLPKNIDAAPKVQASIAATSIGAFGKECRR